MSRSPEECLEKLESQIEQLSGGDRTGLLESLKALRLALLPAPPCIPSVDGLKLDGLLGRSGAILNLLQTIVAVAPSNLSILLEGETGTGKEMFARTIHNNSGRDKFVAVNCGAFPSGLIESELFGHVKGAFTGASSDRKGKFEEAHDGTIFLDEIGELEPFAQVKLLRVLESGEIQRVGSDQPKRVNVRVIAATNRDLDEMVRQGKFREDLFYRINMCPLYLPALRERREDIPALFDHFLRAHCRDLEKPIPPLDEELRHFLFHIYDYRGNIRELRNICQFIACVASSRPLQRSDLPIRVGGDLLSSPPTLTPVMLPRSTRTALAEKGTTSSGVISADSGTGSIRGRTAILRQAEQSYWVALLKKHKGSIQKIAEETNLSPSRIYQILERCRLKPKDYR
jgi:transcriptional regulator with GAF, ATPase, and Fis domain